MRKSRDTHQATFWAEKQVLNGEGVVVRIWLATFALVKRFSHLQLVEDL